MGWVGVEVPDRSLEHERVQGRVGQSEKVVGAENLIQGVDLRFASAVEVTNSDPRTAIGHLGPPSREASTLCSQAIGRGCGRRIGVISLYTNRRWTRACERHPACASARHRPARACPRPQSIAGGGKPTIQPGLTRQRRRTIRGSRSTPPAPRRSPRAATRPTLLSAWQCRTVASNWIWVRRNVSIGNQPGCDSLFENPS